MKIYLCKHWKSNSECSSVKDVEKSRLASEVLSVVCPLISEGLQTQPETHSTLALPMLTYDLRYEISTVT